MWVMDSYAVGGFGDVRLKKWGRGCMRRWSVSNALACGGWGVIGRGRCGLGDFWRIGG